MKNKLIHFNRDANLEEIKESLSLLNSNPEVKSILVLIADGSSEIKPSLPKVFTSSDKNLFGGFFPKLVLNKKTYDKGCLIVGLKFETTTHKIENLSKGKDHIVNQLVNIKDLFKEAKSILMYVDGLSSEISSFIGGVYNHFGANFNYMGGGAGSLSFKQSPCIITNKGIFEDCALMIETQQELGVGVSHGWEKLAGPFRVTESIKNKVISLDWEPAFEVYKKVIENKIGHKFNQDNFFDIAKGFPFGINKLDSEVVVRDPILTEKSSLVCVGEVPENEFVNILIGTNDSLIKAASQASNNSLSLVKNTDPQSPTLLMDCISRVLFMGDEFEKELNAIKQEGLELVGALCLGEIANNGNSYLEFFNKTCVVGSIGDAI